MTIDMAIRNLSNNFEKLDPKLKKVTIDTIKKFLNECRDIEKRKTELDKKYDQIFKALSNRCYTLMHGSMCFFCDINECKFRKVLFRDEEIDPFKLMNICPSELDEALKNGTLKKDKS